MSDSSYEYEMRQVPVQNRLLAQAGHTEWKRVAVPKLPTGYILRTRYERDFGAIAYSHADRCWSWSSYFFTRDQAEEAALKSCQGSDPVILAWGDRCWLAIAEGGKIATAYSGKKTSAMATAKDAAGRYINGQWPKVLGVFYTAMS